MLEFAILDLVMNAEKKPILHQSHKTSNVIKIKLKVSKSNLNIRL